METHARVSVAVSSRARPCNRLAPSGLLSITKPLTIDLHPDRALVEAVLAEVPGAFERLVSVHHGLCWSITYRMARSAEDAHDLCQETFLRVHQNLYQYRFECPLKNWIGRVAYSIALRHLKRTKSALGAELQSDVALLQPEDEVEAVDHAAGYDQETDARRLRRVIQSLPVLQRSILSMYHFDGMSIPEISQVTGLAAGTIKSHLFRSRLKLKELLEPGVAR